MSSMGGTRRGGCNRGMRSLGDFWAGMDRRRARIARERKRTLHQATKKSENVTDREFAQPRQRLRSRSGRCQECTEGIETAFPLGAVGRRDGIAYEQANEAGLDPRLQHLQQLDLDACDLCPASGQRGERAKAGLPYIGMPGVQAASGEE